MLHLLSLSNIVMKRLAAVEQGTAPDTINGLQYAAIASPLYPRSRCTIQGCHIKTHMAPLGISRDVLSTMLFAVHLYLSIA